MARRKAYSKLSREGLERLTHALERYIGLQPEIKRIERSMRERGGRKPGRAINLADIDSRILDLFKEARKAHREPKISFLLLTRLQPYSPTTAFNVLRDEGYTLAQRVTYLKKKSFTK